MAATVPASNPLVVDGLIVELEQAEDPRRLETVADALGAAAEQRAAAPLLRRLGCRLVQRNEYVEDAVCSALVALEVMRRSRSGRYVFRPAHEIRPELVELIRTLDGAIPMRYFMLTTLRREGPRPLSANWLRNACRHGKVGECPYCREHA
jgi:hypothetical protein